MENELINEIHLLNVNIQMLKDVLQDNFPHFWDTQWFSAIVGSSVTLFIIGIGDHFSNRRKILDNWYRHIVERQQPEHLFEKAFITSYGHKITKDGKTEIIPEKTFSEKILIQFRRYYKYQNLPWSCLRFLLWRYEKALCKLPDVGRKQLKGSEEYLKARKIFAKIISLAEKKTGENQWTIREP